MNPQTETHGVMLTNKGQALIVTTDGQTVTLHAAFPVPPGTPLFGTLEGTTHGLRVKVHGCRRREDTNDTASCQGSFEITGRWVNLSREARLSLLRQRDVP